MNRRTAPSLAFTSLVLVPLAVACLDDAPSAPAPLPPECDAADDAPLGETLSSTGFFGAGVESYEVLAPLWSDGADKHRFVKLPCGAQIDTSEMDDWRFPKGTTLWKEFVVDGRKVETRVFKKIGDAADAWDWSAYAWNADQSDAVKAPQGGTDDVTGWTIPSRDSCMECHSNLPGGVIGFSALQLGHDAPGITLASLVETGRLTNAPARAAPGVHAWPSVARRALLALHGSCGHCHREGGVGTEYTAGVDATGAAVPGLVLRIRYDDADPAQTGAMRTAVNVALSTPLADDVTLRIAAGDPSHSGLFHRMTNRGDWTQMPPLATAEVDDASAADVNAWIETLAR